MPNSLSASVSATFSGSRLRRSTFSFNPAAVQFASAINLASDAFSAAVATGDFNQDGKLDLVTIALNSAFTNNISVYLGAGNGRFAQPIELQSGTSDPFSLKVGDFNGDDRLDLITANRNANSVSVLLGNGNGRFQAAQIFSMGRTPRSVAVADLNDDGRLDAITANSGTDANSITVRLGRGNGTLQAARQIAVNALQPIAVATGDFNDDDRIDVVTANFSGSTVSMLLGKGDGSFREPVQYQINATAPLALVTGDFNEDGDLDLATANFGGSTNQVTLLFGDGEGGFDEGRVKTIGGAASAIDSSDFDGDGHLDLAVANYATGQVTILLGDGEGEFEAALSPVAGSRPSGLAIGDFDDDGKPDIAVSNGGTRQTAILPNRTSWVVLDPDNDFQLIDASRETRYSITVDLSTDTLTVNSSPSFTRSVLGYQNVQGSQRADRVVGSSAANQLAGNGGRDTLLGEGGDDQLTGGEQADRLTGGSGSDQFIFDIDASFSRLMGTDRITDFTQGQDQIVLDRSTFPNLGRRLSLATVTSLREAQSSPATITYLRSTGSLYYNQNATGAGFGRGGLFAQISPRANLTIADFVIRS